MEFMVNAIGFSFINRSVHGSSISKTAICAIKAISASIFRKSVNHSIKPVFYFLP